MDADKNQPLKRLKEDEISFSPQDMDISLFLFTHIFNEPHDHAKVTSFYVQRAWLEEVLDRYGCHEDYDDVKRLAIGETLSFGFAQGSVPGLVVTRILGKHEEM